MAFLIVLLVLNVAPAVSSEPPGRVVSINLCADILALQLGVRPVAVSAFAADPDYSPVAEMAAGIPVTSGNAEEVLRLQPDRVLAGRHTARFAVRLLRRAGVPVTQIEPANDFAGIRRNVRTVARALGRERAGEDAIRRFDAALEEVRGDALTPRRSAVLYLANGYTTGKGSLYNAVLDLAGLDNVAAQMGVGAYGFLTVEQVLRAAPDIIIRAPGDPQAPALAYEKLNHRALRRYAQDHPVITAPSGDWFCGTPRVAAAARRILAALSDAIPSSSTSPAEPARDARRLNPLSLGRGRGPRTRLRPWEGEGPNNNIHRSAASGVSCAPDGARPSPALLRQGSGGRPLPGERCK
ncbi:MAG: ABC transporter substrate-binding protein, partial [Alphaproteobacteria bacterium]